MGSEQSQPATSGFGKIAQNPSYGRSMDGRGATSSGGAIASGSRSFDTGRRERPRRTLSDESLATVTSESRPVSPPMSVYSDSDLPYISYTDKPIGDSPSKGRHKNQLANKLMRASTLASDRPSSSRQQPQTRPGTSAGKSGSRQGTGNASTAHNIVIVRSGPTLPARHADIAKLQSIPQFLPVIRGTLSLPANRDPEVLERLQPVHLQNICSRLQVFMNDSANRVVTEQSEIYQKIRRVDMDMEKVQATNVERERQYSQMAESFSKVRQIGHQLAKCNALLNQNLESLAALNELLPIDERLDPFVWQTD